MNPRLKYTRRFIFESLLIPIFLLCSLSSCVTQRNLLYINGKQSSFNDITLPEYQLKPSDALYIKINSIDDASSNVFAQQGQEGMLDEYAAYMNSFQVDKDGFVLLPVIGKISVSGKTTSEVEDLIRDSITNIISLPTVTVKLVNRYVSVLGEVNSPGHFVYSQDKFTIFNAIGLAGDISEFGDRKQVLITRNENGKNNIIRIDLSKNDILSSPYYYIQPNDMIYVKPLKKRMWGLSEFPFTIIFSTITTAIVVYTFVEQRP